MIPKRPLSTTYSSFITTLLQSKQVRCRSVPEVARKLEAIKANGTKNCAMIIDFDHTLTKYHDNGKLCPSFGGVFRQIPALVPPMNRNRSQYSHMEHDLSLSHAERFRAMETWFSKTFELIAKAKISKSQFEKLVSTSGLQLRERADEFLQEIGRRGIPIHVFSAGSADVIELFLGRTLTQVPAQLSITGNRMIFDETGVCVAFVEPVIHPYNKTGKVLAQSMAENTPKTAVLFGDSAGDIDMARGLLEDELVLKIGFLNKEIETRLESYCETYDLVLCDEQTFDVPQTILKRALH